MSFARPISLEEQAKDLFFQKRQLQLEIEKIKQEASLLEKFSDNLANYFDNKLESKKPQESTLKLELVKILPLLEKEQIEGLSKHINDKDSKSSLLEVISVHLANQPTRAQQRPS